jgi:tRNA pseudouridine38-40 synthase
MRFFIKFSYNGTYYHGWQSQTNAVTVQEILTNAMEKILRNPVQLVGAGRTDSGVHASEMYAHFDFDEALDCTKTTQKVNAMLPLDIAVYGIFEVAIDLHARFSAKSRTYQYYINAEKNPFVINQSWYLNKKLDIEKMNQAAEKLLEHTDFECFSKVQTEVNTFNCKIQQAFWTSENNQLIFTITADRFLRNMVRAIVGTLINVGLKKITIEDFENIINSKDRQKAGFSVPACGLFLRKVTYDEVFRKKLK